MQKKSAEPALQLGAILCGDSPSQSVSRTGQYLIRSPAYLSASLKTTDAFLSDCQAFTSQDAGFSHSPSQKAESILSIDALTGEKILLGTLPHFNAGRPLRLGESTHQRNDCRVTWQQKTDSQLPAIELNVKRSRIRLAEQTHIDSEQDSVRSFDGVHNLSLGDAYIQSFSEDKVAQSFSGESAQWRYLGHSNLSLKAGEIQQSELSSVEALYQGGTAFFLHRGNFELLHQGVAMLDVNTAKWHEGIEMKIFHDQQNRLKQSIDGLDYHCSYLNYTQKSHTERQDIKRLTLRVSQWAQSIQDENLILETVHMSGKSYVRDVEHLREKGDCCWSASTIHF